MQVTDYDLLIYWFYNALLRYDCERYEGYNPLFVQCNIDVYKGLNISNK